jgi:hypothetical protein
MRHNYLERHCTGGVTYYVYRELLSQYVREEALYLWFYNRTALGAKQCPAESQIGLDVLKQGQAELQEAIGWD